MGDLTPHLTGAVNIKMEKVKSEDMYLGDVECGYHSHVWKQVR